MKNTTLLGCKLLNLSSTYFNTDFKELKANLCVYNVNQAVKKWYKKFTSLFF